MSLARTIQPDLRKKKINWQKVLVIFLFAAVTALGAVLCFRQGFGPGRLGVRIAWYVGGSVSAILSCVSWFIFAATLNSAPRNLFLYDRDAKTDLSVEELQEMLQSDYAEQKRNARM